VIKAYMADLFLWFICFVSAALCWLPSYLWQNFERKFQTFMEVTQSHSSVANLATVHLAFWTAAATDWYSFEWTRKV